MPHLQFDTTVPAEPAEKRAFGESIVELFADHMGTGTGHVAVSVRVLDSWGYVLGRLDPDDEALMLNADIRQGRPFERQRSFVLAAFDEAHARFGIPTENMYAVLTQHAGEEFHEYDRVLASWDASEAGTGAEGAD